MLYVPGKMGVFLIKDGLLVVEIEPWDALDGVPIEEKIPWGGMMMILLVESCKNLYQNQCTSKLPVFFAG